MRRAPQARIQKVLDVCRHKAKVCWSHFQPILRRLSKADIKVQLLDLPEWKRKQEGVGGGERPFWKFCLDNIAPVNHKNAKYIHDDLIISSRISAYLMNRNMLYRYI